MTDYLEGKEVDCKALAPWVNQLDPEKKPPVFTKREFWDFQDLVVARALILDFSPGREILNEELITFLSSINKEDRIFRRLLRSREKNPFFQLAEKVVRLQDHFVSPTIKKDIGPLILFLINLRSNLTKVDDPRFIPAVKAHAPIIEHLMKKELRSPLLNLAWRGIQKNPIKLPIGVINFYQFPARDFFSKNVVPFVLGTPHDHMNLTVADKKAGLAMRHYVKTVSCWRDEGRKRYLVRLNSDHVPLHLRERIEKAFYAQLQTLIVDGKFWKPLKHSGTEIHRANLSNFPLPLIKRVASASYFHRLPFKHWDPDRLNLRSYRHQTMLCSQFVYVVIHDAIRAANGILRSEGYPSHPYPADGKEVLLGMTTWRVKFLLERTGMLQLVPN